MSLGKGDGDDVMLCHRRWNLALRYFISDWSTTRRQHSFLFIMKKHENGSDEAAVCACRLPSLSSKAGLNATLNLLYPGKLNGSLPNRVTGFLRLAESQPSKHYGQNEGDQLFTFVRTYNELRMTSRIKSHLVSVSSHIDPNDKQLQIHSQLLFQGIHFYKSSYENFPCNGFEDNQTDLSLSSERRGFTFELSNPTFLKNIISVEQKS